jgi:hypothetical protein
MERTSVVWHTRFMERRGSWDHPLSTGATEHPNIRGCTYREAAKAYTRVLPTATLKASLLLQNIEEWVQEVHTLGSRSLERREDRSELILQKRAPPEARQLHQKLHQKTKCDRVDLFASLQWTAFFYMGRAWLTVRTHHKTNFPYILIESSPGSGTHSEGKSSTWRNTRCMLFAPRSDRRQEVHHAKPEVTLRLCFANAPLA